MKVYKIVCNIEKLSKKCEKNYEKVKKDLHYFEKQGILLMLTSSLFRIPRPIQ